MRPPSPLTVAARAGAADPAPGGVPLVEPPSLASVDAFADLDDLDAAYWVGIKQLAGEETTRRLYVTNPQAAVDGAPWPEQPESVGLWERVPLKFRAKKFAGPSGRNSDADSGDEAPEARKAGFFKRLFVR